MLSKLVTWAENRAEAISRMNRALGEYQISGIKTTIPFFQTILSHPKFLSAELSTDFIEKFYRPTRSLPHRKELREVAAVGAALFASRARASRQAAETCRRAHGSCGGAGTACGNSLRAGGRGTR